jgi:hypothetical protein
MEIADSKQKRRFSRRKELQGDFKVHFPHSAFAELFEDFVVGNVWPIIVSYDWLL